MINPTTSPMNASHMKYYNRFLLLGTLLLLILSCKKDIVVPEGNVEAPEFTYNVAIKRFQPDPQVHGTIKTNFDIKTVYYYLQRTNKTDSLLQIDFLDKGIREHAFSIKSSAWAGTPLENVKGLKILSVRDNNTSLEQFLAITYFNPDAPLLKDFPETLTPSLTGSTTITGKAASPTGLSKIYFYDNKSGSFEVLDSLSPNGAKDVPVNYAYHYADGAGQLKVEAIDIYGLKAAQVIQFTNIPFKPVITFAANTLKVALPHGHPPVTGTLKTYTPITQVNAYIVSSGSQSLHRAITPVLTSSSANEYHYSFSIDDFPYAANVTECKLEVMDANGSNTSSVPVEILSYYHWKNLTMMAQGNASTNSASCFFVGNTSQPTLSACEVVNDAATHATIDFAIFCNSTPYIAFNNPANISASTIGTFRCDGTSWSPATPTSSTLKKTLFRVLSGSAEATIQNELESGNITQLDDAFFAGVNAPTANAPNSTQFVAGSLIYAKMTPAGGGSTKNILIKVISVNVVAVPQQGTSTITFDILKEQ